MAEKPLQIGVLTGRTPYPNGMAGTQRIHLMSRAMAEASAEVTLWVDGLDHWSQLRNPQASGTKDGLRFEYLLGKTQASSRKWHRIYDRLALAREAGRRIADSAGRRSLDGLYFYTSVLQPDFERFLVHAQARRHRFPVVIDLCEAPWSLRSGQSPLEKLVSPLRGADGAICISGYLTDWLRQENRRTGRSVRPLEVPVLVDVEEFIPPTAPASGKRVLFAGSSGYNETMRFLLAAMDLVWARHPECELVITGGTTEATLGPVAAANRGRIRYAGFLEREALRDEYLQASALAIPLFDDVVSCARFPTKLGEYLASGRPVVTSRVGEIPHYLEDGVSAQLARPGDSVDFGCGLCRLLEDPSLSLAVGRHGRQVAQRHFHYAIHGAKLCEFFASLKRAVGTP